MLRPPDVIRRSSGEGLPDDACGAVAGRDDFDVSRLSSAAESGCVSPSSVKLNTDSMARATGHVFGVFRATKTYQTATKCCNSLSPCLPLAFNSGSQALGVFHVHLAADTGWLPFAYFALVGSAAPLSTCMPVGLLVDCVSIGSSFLLFSSFLMPLPMHMELMIAALPWQSLRCNGSVNYASCALHLLPSVLDMFAFASRLGGLLLIHGSVPLDMRSLTCPSLRFVLHGAPCFSLSPDALMTFCPQGLSLPSLPLANWLYACFPWTYACIGLLLVIGWSYRIANGTVDHDGDLVLASDWSLLCVTATLPVADCFSVAAPWQRFPNQGRVSPRMRTLTTATPTRIPPWRLLRWMIRFFLLLQHSVAGGIGFIGLGIVQPLPGHGTDIASASTRSRDESIVRDNLAAPTTAATHQLLFHDLLDVGIKVVGCGCYTLVLRHSGELFGFSCLFGFSFLFLS